MTSATLSTLFYANRGNISDKWEQYLAIYEAELGAFRGRPIALLEVGVQNGGSMQVWSKYFDPLSTFVGLDIDERIRNLDRASNVELFVADATDASQIEQAIGNRAFDIIIDDGSHFSGDIIATLRLLFCRLRPGGRYFIEDLHCAYWKGYGGGLGDSKSAVEYLKSLVDVLHVDHLEEPAQWNDADEDLIVELRKGLVRVTFYDSVAVLERLAFTKTEPYRRVVAGDDGTLQDPRHLVAELDTSQLMFTEPLARRLEDGLLERARSSDAIVAARPHAMHAMSWALQARARSRQEMQAADAVARRTFDDYAAALSRIAALEVELSEVSRRAADFGTSVVSLRNQVAAIERSSTYRAMTPVRAAISVIRRRRPGRASPVPEPVLETPTIALGDGARPTLASSAEVLSRMVARRARRKLGADAYRAWCESYGVPSGEDRRLIGEHIADGSLPNLTVLVRVEGSDPKQIDRALGALSTQRFENWVARITPPATDSVGDLGRVVKRHLAADPRMTLIAEDTSAAVGTGIVVVTSTSVTLAEHALYLFASAAQGTRLGYGDSELVDPTSGALLPIFKPNFSPVYQRLHGYIGSTFFLNNSDGADTGPIDEFLRGQRSASDVIAKVLADHPGMAVARLPFVVQTESAPPPSAAEIGGELIEPVRVTVIIPTRDRLDLLRECLKSLRLDTDYPPDLVEIVVVDNGSTDANTLTFLREGSSTGDFSVIVDGGDFNYPRLNNRAAAIATGTVLVLLNNDTTVFDPSWLKQLVRLALEPGVGAVGAKLLYPDLSLQHGGVVLGIHGVAGHVNHMLPLDHDDYREIADRTHEVSAVTGACLAIRAEVYRELGGLDETLAVAFNDVDLCCTALTHGYRNLYVGLPLVVHHESKSRGHDVTLEQQMTFRDEAVRARLKHPAVYSDDPYYNPNLSLTRPYDLAEPPRAVRPWLVARRRRESSRCVLMLSSTHQVGHGVAVVLDMQARYLAALGHRVILGGPLAANDFAYEGCERVQLHDPVEAAKFARECRADVVMIHTPPFFGAARLVGPEHFTIAYDYGEPPPELFADAAARRSVLADKRLALAAADVRYAISEAVREESGFEDMKVLPLGNVHLATWNADHAARRASIRARRGWNDRIIVLNVCRFHGAERSYKGVDAYAALRQVVDGFAPTIAEKLVFVLCGKADPEDVVEMELSGLTVDANVSDDELVGLYAAADLYVNLSRWEGYNLGIGQALAMGLPTLASDIPAHRAFGIPTTDNVVEQVEFLEAQVATLQASKPPTRLARVWDWEGPLEQLSDLVEST
jgi:GT2 family glycosyltransferase